MAEIHTRGNVSELEAYAVQLSQLDEDAAPLVGTSEADAARRSLFLGKITLRGYFKPKEEESEKKSVKPDLNTDDLDDFY